MLKSPVGTLTFLMTDIEGSTSLWEGHTAAMTLAVPRSEQLIHDIVAEFDGYHVVEQGEGDSTLSVFNNATNAALAANRIRETFATEPWPDGIAVQVRTGLHSGVADMRQHTYYGRAVNRAARIRAVAHGGQVILSRATKELLDPQVFPHVKDHGPHRLKDLLQAEYLFELPSDKTFPPLKSLNLRPTNLPVQLTSFVGRKVDIEAVNDRLGRSRLVTLLGPGGTGKTRLSMQVAAEAESYPDGVFFIDLVSARTAEDIDHAITQALQIESAEELKDRRLLLILDNCEHIAEIAASASKELLTSIPELTILATSREALQLRAEITYRVPPLSLPDANQLDRLACVRESEAVQLFVERAEAKVPNFELTEANCATVGAICRRLDGLALAIELAAPRLKMLSPEGVLKRLDERFELLKDRDHTESERHRTLLTTLEHSYELLTPDEQTVLRHLGVFRSGWTLEAVEAVIPEDLRGGALELLESLYDKSLVQVAEGGTQDGRAYLLESIRDYAASLLAGRPEERQRACAQLCVWLTGFSQSREERIRSGDHAAVDDLNIEMPNVMAALDWSNSGGDPALGLQLVTTVWQQWSRRGTFREGRAILESLLDKEPGTAGLQGLGWLIASTLAWYQDDLDAAESMARRSLPLFEEAGELFRVVRAKNALGLIEAARGNAEKAAPILREALSGFIEFGDSQSAVSCGINLGKLELDSEHPEAAEAVLLDAYAHMTPDMSATAISSLYSNLSHATLMLGRSQDSARWMERALPFLTDESCHAVQRVHILLVAACLLAKTGQFDATEEALVQYWKMQREFNLPSLEQDKLFTCLVAAATNDFDLEAARTKSLSTVCSLPELSTIIRNGLTRYGRESNL